jgi:vitamin B12 transporter
MIADYNPEVTQSDFYVNSVYLNPSGLNLNVGMRYNYHNAYDGHWTYSLNPSYSFDLNADHQMKILTSYSKAFIAPGLYQLYDPFYGNSDLLPENNVSFQLSISIAKKIRHLFLAPQQKAIPMVGMPIPIKKFITVG